MAKLTKKERELMDWYKLKYRFYTAKTFEDYMEAVKQANDFAALYNKRPDKVLASFQR